MRLTNHRAFSLAPIVLVLSALMLGPATHCAAATFRLTRWEEPAVLLPLHAPGVELFRLIAVMQRPRGPGATGAYHLRIVLPDGQAETRPIPERELTAQRLNVLVPSSAVRNLRPAQVVVRVSVLDAATAAPISNVLTATIADFPHPAPEGSRSDPGPFGWGEPLSGSPGGPRLLPRPAPDGFRFVRVPATEEVPGFFIATTEATSAQVTKRLPGYDPRAGRSDEFTLEDPAQPALGLSPNQAQAYLEALGKADHSGMTYRLPTHAEWLRAARAGRASAFWWGDDPTYPAGANFLGPEPALASDATAPSHPVEREGSTGFVPNTWGLYHTFGNVAEWASTPAGGFVRLGGHFRTEPASPLPEVEVAGEKADSTGPDPYVGVRPAFDLTAETGAERIGEALRGDPLLSGVSVAYDPDRAVAVLTGTLPEPALRRAADRRLEPLWFLAAVEDRIVTPSTAPGQLATLGTVAGTVRRITPLGRWLYEVPVSVRWGDPLPVRGSEWWVNVYPAGDGNRHYAHKMIEIQPNSLRRVTVVIDRAKMTAAGLPADAPVWVALSLGAEAPAPTDSHVVSNVAVLRWSLP